MVNSLKRNNENYKRAMERVKYSKLHFYLFSLIMLDFIFTYIGINKLNVIREGNPIIVWMFELPFLQALLIRLLYGFLVIILCVFICESQYKYYNEFIALALAVNILILILHLRWVVKYFINTIS